MPSHKRFFRRRHVRKGSLEGAFLGSANLRHVNFSESHLQGANLTQSSLQGANFSWADLRAVDLSGAILKDAEFGGSTFGEQYWIRQILQMPNTLRRNLSKILISVQPSYLMTSKIYQIVTAMKTLGIGETSG